MKASDVEIQQHIITDEIIVEEDGFQGLSNADIDIIFEKAFGALSPEGKIDSIIDEFIESLKD